MILLRHIRNFLNRTLFNPRDWFTWALVFLAAFSLAHLLGWRDSTSIISGTLPTGTSFQSAAFQGTLYLFTWFAAILLTPILLIATALHFLLTRLFPSPGPKDPSLTENTEKKTY